MGNITLDYLKNELKRRNINLSYQRLKVLEYLVENPKSHPTVDQIYTHLQKDIPTLSKTTVYNTLKLLDQLDMIRVVTIDDNEARYDINVQDHGHFICESCGEVYDFDIDMTLLESKDLENFVVSKKNVYFKGICPRCH